MTTMLDMVNRLRPNEPCEWYLLCPYEAVDFREHPILGMVPVCHQHTDPGPDPADADMEF